MRLYCGNISYDTSKDDLREFFEKEGFTVTDAHVCTDRDTGKSRGFGFVTLDSQQAGQEAIQKLNEIQFMGRKLIVNEAREKSQTSGGRRGGNDRSRGSHRRDDDYDR